MMRVPKEEIKRGLPLLGLIILQDKRGHKRILVPKCQRIALKRTEDEITLRLKGNPVYHKLSRSYFWPHMAEEIKLVCRACSVCQQALVQRQNLSATFRQADEKDLPLPRQAYGIDFYGHKKGPTFNKESEQGNTICSKIARSTESSSPAEALKVVNQIVYLLRRFRNLGAFNRTPVHTIEYTVGVRKREIEKVEKDKRRTHFVWLRVYLFISTSIGYD
jgi:hypothetical protein